MLSQVLASPEEIGIHNVLMGRPTKVFIFRPGQLAVTQWSSSFLVDLSPSLEAPLKPKLIALSRLAPASHRAAALGLGFNSLLITGS